ncbi:MAG: TonB-dependent receptor [Acidobacteria bacterium]|nr:TonB-dependent receptor [Acidobacteriota bacterium]
MTGTIRNAACSSSIASAVVLALLSAPPAASAQESGAVGGTVSDTTGLVLPGVTVEARSAERGDVESTVTDGGGAFAFADLPPGTYDLTFTLAGFRTVLRDGVVVGAGASVTLDVELALALEERVVVVGSRAEPRSVTESPVPIDAVPFQDVVSQGATTLDYQLRTLIPSFNVATHPISDAATLVRPASLRNLAHDHTLVLVNGKRRHRSSVIAWFAGVTDGAQGPDISTIPAIALRQVEVLRDGASAQYGSDAIAGVMNFLLKDDRAGGASR